MDAFAGLLDGPRARGAFLLRSIMDPPWSIRVQDEAPLSLVAMVRGEAWVVPDDGDAGGSAPGDVVIMRGPDPYVFADDPARRPRSSSIRASAARHPTARPRAGDGSRRAHVGQRPQRLVVMLIGTYQTRRRGQPAGCCARSPRWSCSRSDVWDSPLVPLLADEIVKDEPGQEVVLDRLLDLLLIAVLRAWFSRPEAEAPAWYRAQQRSGRRAQRCG